ncbi:hypothetical protein N7G274_009424 [Stereocaulon virgatum]|uniref:alpha-galactosidase n=1 Tax=Stereocaulon virgatum TaxID=373712 RepID=A0ABR3ZWE0_9LECA
METTVLKEGCHVSSMEENIHGKDGNKNIKRPSIPRRRILIILLVALLILLIGLSVGLGVGLTRGQATDSTSSSSPSTAPTPSTTSVHTTSSTTYPNIWSPTAGTSWQIEIQNPLANTSIDVSVYDIDLFANNASIISTLHGMNRKVICYFSAGSYEDWRPNASQFNKATDLGKPLDGWPGEWWLQANSANVRKIMLARMDMAVSKGCDGVDPDNIDAYDNNNGFSLAQADAVNYVNFLADAAHARSLSVGLKNGGAILGQVIRNMQWSINEQCVKYNECDTFRPFIEQGKPVFHIKYLDGTPDVPAQVVSGTCGNVHAKEFSTVLKRIDLDDWVVEYPSSL